METHKTPINRLLKMGLTPKDIRRATGVSLQMISMLKHRRRKASLKTRKSFFQAYMIDPWAWDK
jgi:hypothetical protein